MASQRYRSLKTTKSDGVRNVLYEDNQILGEAGLRDLSPHAAKHSRRGTSMRVHETTVTHVSNSTMSLKASCSSTSRLTVGEQERNDGEPEAEDRDANLEAVNNLLAERDEPRLLRADRHRLRVILL